ncbi:MAG TPA: ABC transporter permease [Haliscomenobacter sp.]|uniref:ABC transporter permease n=1 Tax=Haliscomenobacter sp. TaxID=2717303 RepID=UPI002CE96B63|nr:ABC transporter permease [Haliscomenobacter sp.]HOY16048.1 ABC transporter permease [Haliscomenobacter sp.]
MGIVLRIIYESIVQALGQLNANRLRSFLSLLGITIGIFCIIGVFSAVDSLEDNVRGSLAKLGDDVIYIQKISWAENPENWFKYLRRPSVDYEDYEIIKNRVKSAELTAFSVGIGQRTVKYLQSSAERTYMVGVSPEYAEFFKLNFDRGRFFSPTEYHYGANKCVLGFKVAEAVFGSLDPIGKSVKINGRRYEVVGVIEKTGESIINIMNYDGAVLISYELARKVANLKSNDRFQDASVCVKAAAGVSVDQMKDEVTGKLRAHRRLKPKQEDNFSLNQLSIISNFLSGFFNVLNVLGVFIGGFAILVGMFSVANIMFVSVKERTRLIGIKKALGAKRYIILLEFLIESIILCILGGLAGLALVIVAMAGLSQISDSFQLYLSFNNAALGIILSTVIGVLAGMIPALQASRMDPVEAMRK